MMFDFGLIPPEINSARMYGGPGAAPLLAAAAAWDTLATELTSAAAAYRAVISELTTSRWLGPASASMVATITPFESWITSTAGRAELAGMQARAAAAAFEMAHDITVPPPVVMANRTLLAMLVATNFLGQNTPAIATNEAHYAEMWAQDATAMYGYASACAVASKLIPFTPPPQSTDSAGLAGQAAAVAEATTTPAGTAGSLMSQMVSQLYGFSAVTPVLQHISSPTPWYTKIAEFLESVPFSVWLDLMNLEYQVGALIYDTQGYTLNVLQLGQSFAWAPAGAAAGADAASTAAGVPSVGLSHLNAGEVSASLGQANKIGAISTPPSWSTSPQVPPAAAGSIPSAADLTATESGPAGLLRGIPASAARGDEHFSRRRQGSHLRVIGPRAIG